MSEDDPQIELPCTERNSIFQRVVLQVQGIEGLWFSGSRAGARPLWVFGRQLFLSNALHLHYSTEFDLYRISMPELSTLRHAFRFSPHQTAISHRLQTRSFHHAAVKDLARPPFSSRPPLRGP